MVISTVRHTDDARNDKNFDITSALDTHGGLITYWPPLKSQPSLLGTFGSKIRTHKILLESYRPDHSDTGVALAITGPLESAAALSMRMTWPGTGGTKPMRRAITSMRSGSRSEACSRRSA